MARSLLAKAGRPSGLALLAGLCLPACGHSEKGDAPLSKAASTAIPNVPVPPADGPKLGALANVTPVLERPAEGARVLGYLHAGAKVARAPKPYSTEGCPGGWYPVRPQGFVCAGDGATTELGHPTMVAMALQPKLDQPLPWTYARVKQETPLYARDPDREDAVKEVGKLPGRSGLAVVGSWSAMDPQGQLQRLALTTDGRFVKTVDLEAARPAEFQGVPLSAEVQLPIAFVVKRGVRRWTISEGQAEKQNELDVHTTVALTGKYREIDGLRYWATTDEKYVRHRDVTVVRARSVWPEWAAGGQKWIDVSVVTGVMVLYEGQRPLFVTLVSTGRDRLGDPKTTASTALGTWDVVAKHVTFATADAKQIGDGPHLYDAPWVLELSSGQAIHGAYWHARFGIENGPGHVQVAPADALRLWQWVDPPLPEGWHGLSVFPQGTPTVKVVIRK